MERMERIRGLLKKLPNRPGVYLMHDERGKIIYVGKAKNLKRRVSSYFNHKDFAIPRLRKLVATVCDITTIRTASDAEAYIVESRLIKAYQPFFNVELKMGTRYPWAVVTDEPFPRLVVTRRRDIKGRYFGPFISAGALKDVLHIIEKAFPLRSCKYDLTRTKLSRPCLDYGIGKCDAPCVGLCTAREYGERVDDVILLLSGQTADLIARLRARMEECASRLEFEAAGVARDAIRSLWRMTRSQVTGTLSDDLDEDSWTAMKALQELVGLPTVPWRIDGFDISHHAGCETYGVSVVFEQGYPNPSLYRRFKIRTVDWIDDFRSIEETVTRKYRMALRAEAPLPQLAMIDGGPQQLAFARKALAELELNLPTVALAEEEELIYTAPDAAPIRLPRNDPALRLLQRVRDEAHRFAITSHRRASTARFSRSALEDIPGIGKHTSALLLSAFGSVRRVAGLSEEELSSVKGIGPVTARRIKEALCGSPAQESEHEYDAQRTEKN